MDSSDDDTFGEDSNINDESDLGEIDEIFEDDDDDLGNQSSMSCDQDRTTIRQRKSKLWMRPWWPQIGLHKTYP